MIELLNDTLVFRFPDVHPNAELRIEFQRTLRIPDDGKAYPLPPGLGRFPMRHVDDFADRVPPRWLERGGVMFPMYQAEAMWLNFRSGYVPDRATAYPFAIKIATGKRSAVTGEEWREGLHALPDQDYVVAPRQPWLDGYVVEKGYVRQFVAMPLGDGYSAEEQLTGKAEHGGVQIQVYPMKRAEFDRRFPVVPLRETSEGAHAKIAYSLAAPPAAAAPDMGLAPGGRMRQEVYDDPYGINEWDTAQRGRCFVHLCNSLVWRSITGVEPPTTPPTAAEYSRAGLPWFDYYADGTAAVKGSAVLNKLKSVFTLGTDKGSNPLPENESVETPTVVELRAGLGKNEVRSGDF